MIQTALFFILGFLCAGFIAILVAPAIWRRAVVLTRRRIEGSLPLTMDEIQADKDRLRAEFAVSTRQLEITIKSLKDKIAGHLLQDGRDKEELVRLAAAGIEKDGVAAKAHARIEELNALVAKQDEKEKVLETEIAALNDRIKAQAAEIARLGRMYDDASFAASSRQIELVSLEAKVDKLHDDASLLRDERKEAQRRAREAEVEAKSLAAALKDEHRKVVAAESRMAQMTASLADSEEKLERREQEVARLRSGDRQPNGSDDTRKLEERLTQLSRENRKLAASLEAVKKQPESGGRAKGTQARGGQAKGGQEGPDESAVLREQIGELAAEVVHLTAMLEGADSPIFKALGDATPGDAANGEMPSLADRIRALREAKSPDGA